MAGAVDVERVQAAYDSAELACDEASAAEQSAFARWQAALGAYERARDESGRAWRAYRAAVGL